MTSSKILRVVLIGSLTLGLSFLFPDSASATSALDGVFKNVDKLQVYLNKDMPSSEYQFYLKNHYPSPNYSKYRELKTIGSIVTDDYFKPKICNGCNEKRYFDDYGSLTYDFDSGHRWMIFSSFYKPYNSAPDKETSRYVMIYTKNPTIKMQPCTASNKLVWCLHSDNKDDEFVYYSFDTVPDGSYYPHNGFSHIYYSTYNFKFKNDLVLPFVFSFGVVKNEMLVNNFDVEYPDSYDGDKFVGEISSGNINSKQKIYPRISVVLTYPKIVAQLDTSYFDNLKIPYPDINKFILVKTNKSIIHPDSFANGVAIFDNVPIGDYRIILISGYLNNSDYVLGQTYFDISFGTDSSYRILYSNDDKRYCYFSNDGQSSNNIFVEDNVVFEHKNCNVSQPGSSLDSSDFSAFNPQSSNSTNLLICDNLDIPCHIKNFFNSFFSWFISIFNFLFIPKTDSLKQLMFNLESTTKQNMGVVYSIVDLFKLSFDSISGAIYPTLFVDSYSPPCNFIPSFQFFGSAFNVDICKLEHVIGTNNFNTLRFFVSSVFVLISMFVVRSIFLNLFKMLGDS